MEKQGVQRTAIIIGVVLSLVLGAFWVVSAATPSAHGFDAAASAVGDERAECWIHLVDNRPARRIVGPWWIEVTDENDFTVKGVGQSYDVQVGDGQLITRGFHGSFAFATMGDCDPVRRRLSDSCNGYIEYLGEKLPCIDPVYVPEGNL